MDTFQGPASFHPCQLLTAVLFMVYYCGAHLFSILISFIGRLFCMVIQLTWQFGLDLAPQGDQTGSFVPVAISTLVPSVPPHAVEAPQHMGQCGHGEVRRTLGGT